MLASNKPKPWDGKEPVRTLIDNPNAAYNVNPPQIQPRTGTRNRYRARLYVRSGLLGGHQRSDFTAVAGLPAPLLEASLRGIMQNSVVSRLGCGARVCG